jgi:Tol biopolymer transport system component
LRRLALAVAILLLAGCGGSSRKGPPDLVFVSTRDGDYALFGVDAAGKHERRLTKDKGDPSTPQGLFYQLEPAWSPDGSRIAFTSRRDGREHVYVVTADGKDTRRLTDSTMDDDHPSWSPDGKRIVFAREGALFAIPSAGGTARRVGRGFGEARDPAWSPDGKLIAYDYREPGTPVREVYVMHADGTARRQVTRLGNVSAVPAWSPDGRRLAFQSNAQGGHFEIYSIGLDGKGLRRITTSPSSDTFEPAWSPDGKLLAFSREGAVWTVDAAGNARRLTSGANDSSPAWRPAVPTATP